MSLAYTLHSLHGQCFGIHDLILFLKILFIMLGPKQDILIIPSHVVRMLLDIILVSNDFGVCYMIIVCVGAVPLSQPRSRDLHYSLWDVLYIR